ncbi:RICIN domain-containing protein [Myceligenerans sp. TRM 65318]|uniref:RICIN domain-containing protein n=2 Tax=Myceligenerans pegani TaxID=2776917 RepID=A0ABR9MWT0_9MICO|nr:RICIN domain-containing protein [Myceligenerans sp. TRM 65318]MBE3018108.1 RICIN domain-containing protein [Myceligenerans sp. TRM 65318]
MLPAARDDSATTSRRTRARSARRWHAAAAALATVAATVTAIPLAGEAQAATIDTAASYVLVSRHSGKVIDVSGASSADGASVIQWTRTDGDNQQWQFVAAGDGYYQLRARHSGKVVDVGSTADGADVVQRTGTGATSQQFRVVDTDSGYVKLLNRASGKALDLWAWSTADGARISQYTDTGGANQQWRLVKVDEGPGGVLSRVHTAGRVRADGDGVRYSWPGVYFEGRFRGTGVGIVLNDSAADYDVQIDGATVATFVAPGETTRWVEGLSDAEHTVRLVKRNESPWAASEFGGFVAAPGGEVLTRPAARTRQIEFIGDSLTVGYGNTSAGRECTGDQVNRTTNTDLSYGALTARRLEADYQVNAFSGKGMVRNYDGGDPGNHYRTYYDRALLHDPGDVWNPGTWRPQLVVVYLGTNDFSTDLNPGEQWTTPEELAADYRGAYGDFLRKLRTRYGTDTTIVAVGAGSFANDVQQVVRERADAGDSRVRYWFLDSTGLDLLGCHWHYSTADHELIADRFRTYVDGLALDW